MDYEHDATRWRGGRVETCQGGKKRVCIEIGGFELGLRKHGDVLVCVTCGKRFCASSSEKRDGLLLQASFFPSPYFCS